MTEKTTAKAKTDTEPETVDKVGTPEKKKKKRTRGTRVMQDGHTHLSKAARKMAKAVEKGIGGYIRRSDKSAGKRRDGAIVDAPRNFVRAASNAMSDVGTAIDEAGKGLDSRKFAKEVRRGVRRFGKAVRAR